MNTKQVIVIRKDLRNFDGNKVRTGKLISQACHASMGSLLSMFTKQKCEHLPPVMPGQISYKYELNFNDESVLNDWLNGKFTKVCVSVDSEEELMEIYNKIPDGWPKMLVTDAGLTEFNGVPTKTCLCIGPYISEEIDKITGHLKLL